jgi:DNA-binding response OmpR family regulator
MTKILVVDDDPEIRRMIVQIFTAAGHEVLEAKDGNEGLSQFHVHQPALVITDILMPEKDGLETILELRRSGSGVAIIAMSDGGTTSTMIFLDMAKNLGADAAIAKPFRASDLVETVAKLLAPESP